MPDYTISIKTGDIPYAYTCECAHITITGTKGRSEELELRKSYIDGFEQGQTDHFLFQDLPDLGEITHVQIRLVPLDPMTPYVKAWYLDRVHIKVRGADTTTSAWSCQCGRWLGTDAGEQLTYTMPMTPSSQVKQSWQARNKPTRVNIAKKKHKHSSNNKPRASIAAKPKNG